MLKQRLQQKLLQKLSPQQIQMIKLLEIPTMQLEQRIKKELEENPALEEGHEENEEYDEGIQDEVVSEDDEFTIDDYLNEEDTPYYKLQASNYSKDDKKEDIPFSVGKSFHDSLDEQLGLRVLSDREMQLGLYLIGSIDEDGYLRRKLVAIADDLAFSQNIDTNDDELLEILKIIQEFDPPGVGARDLQECLLLQIESKDMDDPVIALARKILKYHFKEFTNKHYDKITARCNVDDDELKEAVDEIIRLNPKPGSSYTDAQNKDVQHIIPDFVLENKDGELVLSLNSRNAPPLHVNADYQQMFADYAKNKAKYAKSDKEAMTFVKQKMDSASWFIDAIQQRQNTMLLSMHAILEFQKAYFQEGDEMSLKPMILKDIADMTGLDISTISRVANSKYIQTHFGIYSLKYFFSEGMQTTSGEEVSTREIKTILLECIENEDKKKPINDEKLSEILKEKGYPIARRTVAKYREQLNIPVARLRKEL